MDNKPITRVWLVSKTYTDDNHKCHEIYTYVFKDEESMYKHIKEDYENELKRWNKNGWEIEEQLKDEDDKSFYSKNGNAFYSIYCVGSVLVIMDYDNDWNYLNNEDNNIPQPLVPNPFPKALFIVKQHSEVCGGCCPDLPDSVYASLADASRRVKELYESELKFIKEKGWKIDKSKLTLNKGEIECNSQHIWHKFYIHSKVEVK